jgi:DNA-binding transcriptional LysR family regulator
VPLVTLREPSMLHRVTTSALSQGGRDYEIVFTATAAVGLVAAVSAGLGVALLPRHEVPPDVEIWVDAPLPKPLDLYCGIYLRDGSDCAILEQLADTMADALRLRAGGSAASGAGTASPHATTAHLVPRVR